MNVDDLLREEARDRLRRRIAAAGRGLESPLADLPPAPTSSSRLELTGPTEALLELLGETMAELGLAWCSTCEAWRSSYSHEIGDTGDVGTYCRECNETVDEEIEPREVEAVWQAIPVLRELVRDHVTEVAGLLSTANVVKQLHADRMGKLLDKLEQERLSAAEGLLGMAEAIKRVEAERLTLARGLLAIAAGTECSDPSTWEVWGPYRWNTNKPDDPEIVCWEIKTRDPVDGLIDLVRVLRPMDAEHTREDGERLIAAAQAGLELARRVLSATPAEVTSDATTVPIEVSP